MHRNAAMHGKAMQQILTANNPRGKDGFNKTTPGLAKYGSINKVHLKKIIELIKRYKFASIRFYVPSIVKAKSEHKTFMASWMSYLYAKNLCSYLQPSQSRLQMAAGATASSKFLHCCQYLRNIGGFNIYFREVHAMNEVYDRIDLLYKGLFSSQRCDHL